MRKVLHILFCGVFVILFHQKITAQQSIGHCREQFAVSDTIIAWFHDKNVFHPVKRKIEIVQFNRKWFKVEYEDSEGKIARRRIHRHRVSKFIKRYYKLAEKKKATDGEMILFGITDDHCFEEFHLSMMDSRQCEKARHILKIWVD